MEMYFLVFSYREKLDTEGGNEVIASLKTLMLLLDFSKNKYPKQLKLALKCAVRLCEVKKEYCDTFVELLGTRLDNIHGKLRKLLI